MAGKKGRSGRRPKPTILKLVEGTEKKERRNEREPFPERRIPPPPPWLSASEKVIYDRIGRVVHEKLHCLAESDGESLAMLASAYQEYLEAKREVDDLGVLVEVETRDSVVLKRNPAISTRDSAWKRTVALMAMFGLTPSSRATVQAFPESNDTLAEKWGRRR